MKTLMFFLKAAMIAWIIVALFFVKKDAPAFAAISFLVAAFFGHQIIKTGNKSIKSK